MGNGIQETIEKLLWMRLLKIIQTRWTISTSASKRINQSKEANESTSKINKNKKAMGKSHFRDKEFNTPALLSLTEKASKKQIKPKNFYN